jgi:hypothetical protein
MNFGAFTYIYMYNQNSQVFWCEYESVKSKPTTVFALIFFHLLAQKPNLEKFSIYSNKFCNNFHLSKYSFTCPWLRASGLAQRLQQLHCI